MEHDIAEILEMTDTNQFLKVMQEIFEERVEGKRVFRITGTPAELGTVSVDLDSPELRGLLETPPGRYAGWTVKPLPPLRRNALGYENDRTDYHHLKFVRNGHFEFWTAIDDHFCWRQDSRSFREHPRLYPYPVVEYPVSFCRLYKEIAELLHINSPVIFQMQYLNVKGIVLLPYQPGSIGFDHPMGSVKPLDKNRLVFQKHRFLNGFDPDPAALKLVQDLYFEFGYDRRHIPFFDSTDHAHFEGELN